MKKKTFLGDIEQTHVNPKLKFVKAQNLMDIISVFKQKQIKGYT